jgi:hypothetical protein
MFSHRENDQKEYACSKGGICCGNRRNVPTHQYRGRIAAAVDALVSERRACLDAVRTSPIASFQADEKFVFVFLFVVVTKV